MPLTARRKVLTATGMLMMMVQVIVAAALAPSLTEAGNTSTGAVVTLWAISIPWSVVTVLLLVRQADLPDIFTASFLATVSASAVFALVAALSRRGGAGEVNLVDTLFFGVTVGGMSGLVVWGAAMAIARVLRLPTTEALHEQE
ncbi:MAG: hypothetical protein M3P30_06255 [Chloroflexota bacterium]|nr:hypothetical protein [Chloroflexota bacterium]